MTKLTKELDRLSEIEKKKSKTIVILISIVVFIFAYFIYSTFNKTQMYQTSGEVLTVGTIQRTQIVATLILENGKMAKITTTTLKKGDIVKLTCYNEKNTRVPACKVSE